MHDVVMQLCPSFQRRRGEAPEELCRLGDGHTTHILYPLHRPLVFATVNNNKVICISTIQSIQGRFAAPSPQIMATNVLYARFMCKSYLLQCCHNLQREFMSSLVKGQIKHFIDAAWINSFCLQKHFSDTIEEGTMNGKRCLSSQLILPRKMQMHFKSSTEQ